ncbi:MAG: excinuclease ABC subunit UvrC [Candidatus Woesearchaeota archaeon]
MKRAKNALLKNGKTNLPNEPGCYLFKDETDRIIYVGKAKNISKRVNSYFQKELDPKTEALVSHIDSVDFIVTRSEVEALILENTLIKRHQPKYNINLKDSKRYAYLKITEEEFPRLVLARRRTKGTFFGPFVSGQEREYIRRFLTKTFKLRTCKRMPKKPCLRYHINLCTAPCIGGISRKDYEYRVEAVKKVLSGKTHDLIAELEQKMKAYSDSEDFERAKEMRDHIQALKYLENRQTMDRRKRYDEDIINYIVENGQVYLLLFNVYKGTLAQKHEFTFEYTPDFFEEFLVQYYSEANRPKEVIVPREVSSVFKEWFRVTVPRRGEKRQLLSLVKRNVELTFFGNMKKVESLQKELGLKEAPTVIECIDISHLSGSSTVGSLVQFRNGRPDKSNYRRFKIKTVEGISDTDSIAEVVWRRYSRLKKEGQMLPNLVIIDGGRGQLNAALSELRNIDVVVPIIGLAKREEEVYMPGKEAFQAKGDAKLFLQEIRDEAHRFAISYHRLLRSKR